jgi:hypothetical protein
MSLSMTEASVADATHTTTTIRHVTSSAEASRRLLLLRPDGVTMTAPIARQELLSFRSCLQVSVRNGSRPGVTSQGRIFQGA